MGHILEHSPGNIAQSLRGQGGSHTRPLMVYHTTDGMGEDGRSSSASQWNGHDWTGDDEHQSYLNRDSNQRWEAHDQEVHWDRADSISGLDDSDTSTETSSGDYNDDLPPDPEIDALPAWQRGEAVFWAYAQKRRAWRRFANMPTRKVRRFTTRKGGRGKSGKRSSSYICSSEMDVFLSRKGKSMNRKTSREGIFTYKAGTKGGGKNKSDRDPYRLPAWLG
jgi:hypothetical protein